MCHIHVVHCLVYSINLPAIRRQVLSQLRGPLPTRHSTRLPPVPRWQPPRRKKEKTNLDTLDLVCLILLLECLEAVASKNTSCTYMPQDTPCIVHTCIHAQSLSLLQEGVCSVLGKKSTSTCMYMYMYILITRTQGAPLSTKLSSLGLGASSGMLRRRVHKLTVGMTQHGVHDRLSVGVTEG